MSVVSVETWDKKNGKANTVLGGLRRGGRVMECCVPTSVGKYIADSIPPNKIFSPKEASGEMATLLNVFGWSDYRCVTAVKEEGGQEYNIRLHRETIKRPRWFSVCGLKGPHNCAQLETTFWAPGRHVEAEMLAKKMVLDEWRLLPRRLIPVTQGDVIGEETESVTVKAGNTTVGEDAEIEETLAASAPPEITAVANTSQVFKFTDILNREILFKDLDLSEKDKSPWSFTFPKVMQDLPCVPSNLPLETLMYGNYKFEIVLKLNAHKFTSGLAYVSILPDPVLLNVAYQSAACAVQRHGAWLDFSKANAVRVEVPFEYRRAFVRNLSKGVQFKGAQPSALFSVMVHLFVPPQAGSGQDVKARVMCFFAIREAQMAGLTMQVPLTQGPIKTVARPFKEFKGMVDTFSGAITRVDNLIDEVDTWVSGDKPNNMLCTSSVVPKPRSFFPNGRGLVDVTSMRLDPTAATRIHGQVSDGGLSTINDIARVWGYLTKFDWTPEFENGKQLAVLPLDPTTFAEYNKIQSYGVIPPVSYAAGMCTLWTGQLEFMLRFASTNFHSGAFTVAYEYGRYSSSDTKEACQPYGFQYEAHDLGEVTEFSFVAPYVYDTPWRRVTNIQCSMSGDYGYTSEDLAHSVALKMEPEGRVVIRVGNPLKAATTVSQTVTCLVFVRAAPDFALIGPTRTSYMLSGWEKTATKAKRDGKGSATFVPFHPKYPATLEEWHPTLHQTHHVPNVGDHLINASAELKKQDEVRAQLALKIAERDKLAAALETARSEVSAKQMEAVQCPAQEDDGSHAEAELAQLKLKLDYLDRASAAYRNQGRRSGPVAAPAGVSTRTNLKYLKDDKLFYIAQKGYAIGADRHTDWFWAPVGSEQWEYFKKNGTLMSDWTEREVPVQEAPAKEYTTKIVKVGGEYSPFKVFGNRERLGILDVLRRPLLVLQGVQVRGMGQGSDESTTLPASDIFHCYGVPVMPPQWTHVEKTNKQNLSWVHAIRVSPQVALTGLFRHWVGSNRYTVVVEGATNPVVYVTFVPNTGAITFGDWAEKMVTVGTTPFYKGSVGSTGLMTEMIVPAVNPTATIEIPFYTPNAMATLNGDELTTAGPLRDRSDTCVGHLLVWSKSEFSFDLWWEMGPDAALSSFVGVPPTLAYSAGTLFSDDGPAQPVFPKLVGAGGSPKPTQQMVGEVASLLMTWTGVEALKRTVFEFTGVGKSVSSLVRRSNKLVMHTDNVLGKFEGTVEGMGQAVERTITQIEADLVKSFPQISGTGLVLTAALDMLAAYKNPDPIWIANMVARWLVTAGLVSLSSLTGLVAHLVRYLTSVMRPTSQSFSPKQMLDALVGVISKISYLAEAFKFADTLNVVIDVLTNHRIMKLNWTVRLYETIVRFVRYLYGIAQRVAYWWRGKKDDKARIYYMLSDRNDDLSLFISRMQKWLTPENQAILKVSPAARLDFYATYMVVKQVESAMLQLPAREQSTGLLKEIGEYKKLAIKLSNGLTTAPVRYEPFMLKFYGATAVGKSFIADTVITTLLNNVGVQLHGKPTITRVAGREFWTDVDGLEAAVLIDEAGQINTAEENTCLIGDIFQLKSPAKMNPNQASEDKKDRCINPILCLALTNTRDPNMNEIRDANAFRRRFEFDVEVRAKPHVPKDHEFNHAEYKVTHKLGCLQTSNWMDHETFLAWLQDEHKQYHAVESKNVRFRTKQLLRAIGRVSEEELVLSDPYSVYYRHLYGVESKKSNSTAQEEMELILNQWLTREGYLNPLDKVLSQGPTPDEEFTGQTIWVKPEDYAEHLLFEIEVLKAAEKMEPLYADRLKRLATHQDRLEARRSLREFFSPISDVEEEEEDEVPPPRTASVEGEQLEPVVEPPSEEVVVDEVDEAVRTPDMRPPIDYSRIGSVFVQPPSPLGYDEAATYAVAQATLAESVRTGRRRVEDLTRKELIMLGQYNDIEFGQAKVELKQRLMRKRGETTQPTFVRRRPGTTQEAQSDVWAKFVGEALGFAQRANERKMAMQSEFEDAPRVMKEAMFCLAHYLFSSAEKCMSWCREKLELSVGDCTYCARTCTEIMLVCDDQCNVDVCIKCMQAAGDTIRCRACKTEVQNPMLTIPFWKHLLRMAYPFAEVLGLSVTYVLRAMYEMVVHFVAGYCSFMPLSAILAVIMGPFGVILPVIGMGWSMRYLGGKSTFIPEMACSLYHHVGNAIRLTRVAANYVCDACRKWWRPDPPKTQYIDTETNDMFDRKLDSLTPARLLEFTSIGPVKETTRGCEHDLLFVDHTQEFEGDILEPIEVEMAQYVEGFWVLQSGTTYRRIKNEPCASGRCPLRSVVHVRELLELYYTLLTPLEQKRVVQEQTRTDPYQLWTKDLRTAKWFDFSRPSWLEQFKHVDWWEKFSDLAKVVAKVAAFIGVVVGVLYGLKRVWDAFVGVEEEQATDAETRDCTEEVLDIVGAQFKQYDSTRIRTTKTGRGILRGTPTQAASPHETVRPLHQIMARVTANQVVIHIDTPRGVKKLGALGVKGRFLIMPYHYLTELEKAPPGSITLHRMLSQVVLPYKFDRKDFVREADNDLMLFRAPPQFPAVRDILSHFNKEDYYMRQKVKSQGIIVIPPVLDLLGITAQRVRISEMIQHLETQTPGGEAAQVLHAIQYNFSLPGGCGSVVYQETDTNPIVGIHVAGMGHRNLGLGYGVIVTQEALQDLMSMFDEPCSEPPTAQMGFVCDAVLSLDDYNVDSVGSVPQSHALQQPKETSIVPSLLHDQMVAENFKSTTIPAPLSRLQEPYASAGISPFKAGIRNMGIAPEDIPTSEVEAIQNSMGLAVLAVEPLVVSAGELTIDEAICGVPDVQYYDSLDLSTSPGYPYNKLIPGAATKHAYIKRDDVRRTAVVEQVVLDNMVKQQEKRRRGEMVPAIFADVMKDERVKPSKAAKIGGTRIISMSPLDYTIRFRQIYLHFMAAFMACRISMPHAVGISPDGPEWAHLVGKLKLKNPKAIWTIDYTNFGPGFSTRAAYACFQMMWAWVKQHVKGIHEVEAWVLLEELLNSHHLAHDLIYQQVCGSPSGAPVTVIINTMVNWFYLLWAFARIASRHPELQELVRKKGLWDAWREVCEVFAYGDDAVAATIPKYLAFYNAQTVVAELATLGVVATDASKTHEVQPHVGYDKMEFLKRGCAPHPERPGQYLAPLGDKCVIDTVMWCHKRADLVEATEEVVHASLLNAYSRGPVFYNRWYKHLLKWCQKCQIKIPALSWVDIDNMHFEPTAQAWYRLNMQSKYKHMVISDNLDEDEYPVGTPACFVEEFLQRK